MSQWSSSKVRQTFLDFFASKGHEMGKSAPMVVKGDPTLMFVNAGMNQFKDIFLGIKEPSVPSIVNSQKCLRVSGKHNDLEEVGVDTYHHTMFEMLGNWSFGDYFKEEAIAWAWELLNKVYGIPEDRMYVTYFEGDEGEGLEEDVEAREIWKNYVQPNRILRGNKKDNFWEMGESGPCGPCTEIHVDIRPQAERDAVAGASLVNQDHPQVIEIWNLVFIQFNRKADYSLENLPAQHVDTGMGMERLCAVLEGKQSNYQISLFSRLIAEIGKKTSIQYGAEERTDIAFRVIADHLRAVAFAIADGQLPSNTGAGYVIRRILRRAIRYAYSFLKIEEAFIFQLVDELAVLMGDYFEELNTQKELIKRVIQEEEESFLRTLEKGLTRLDTLLAPQPKKLEGDVVFELYDTFGFPVDLTRLIASEKGVEIDEKGFETALQAQKDRSRAATTSQAGDWVVLATGNPEFVGYDQSNCETRILQYREVKEKKKSYFQLVIEQSPFYPEGGGQVGDKGTLSLNGKIISIFNSRKENNLPILFANELPTEFRQGEFVKAEIDLVARKASARNHSATHLMHFALREILGEHVEQKGSLVNPDYLRFDFSHFGKVTPEELQAIEKRVQDLIWEEIPLEENRAMDFQAAIDKGALALFGEKYTDKVRLIEFGSSKELCGGTHVSNTGLIGSFKITSEGSVASGVRRIEAVTGVGAKQWADDQVDTLNEIKSLFKGAKDPVRNVEQMLEENKRLSDELAVLEKAQLGVLRTRILEESTAIDGVDVFVGQMDKPAGAIKDLLFPILQEDNKAVVIGSVVNEKVTISVGFSKNLVAERNYHAGKLVGDLAKLVQGGGGGQPFFATAGGKNPNGLNEALSLGKEKLGLR